MTGPCFVDANVFVYAGDPRDPQKQKRAADWIDHLWTSRRGRTSAQALSEFYAVATRKLRVSPELAWERVEHYLAWQPCPVDETLLRHAHAIAEKYRLSWWDSLVVAAAQLQECVILLTEDLQDGAALGHVIVRSPFTLNIEQSRTPYDVQVASVHRPRGRPRRAYA